MRTAETLTLTEARDRLLDLAARFERTPAQPVSVTKHGRRVMTLMPAAAFDALVETLEILADARTTRRLRRALREIDRGEGIPWGVARRRLLE